jgi:site-specific DNA recombinase
MKKRAAIYTRVSTLDQGNGASLATQQADCARYCQQAGMVVVAEFEDLQSGLKADRIQYQEMLKQAKEGQFDVIVVWKMDRFGRDHLESGFQVRELQRMGIRVDSATEPNDSPLLRGILMNFAEEESRRISLRVSASKRTLAQQGKRSCPAPFGYRNVGAPGSRTLEPNEDAAVVTEAFRMYASGRRSLLNVRDYVNQNSSSPKRPKTRPGIHHMLRNPVYVGQVRHGFLAKSQIQLKSKAERLAEVFTTEGLHQPLVDLDTFERVQARLKANQPKASGRPRAKFLFSGLIWCACGYRASPHPSGKGKILYYCVRANSAGDCDARSIGETRIIAVVLPPIQALIKSLNQDDLRAQVRANLVEMHQAEQEVVRKATQALSDRLNRLENRLSQWEDMVADGEMTRERFVQRRDEILPQIKELQAQLAEQPQVYTPNLDHLFDMVDTISVDDLDSLAWREIIEAVVEKIIINGRDIEVIWKAQYAPLFSGDL